MGLAYVSSEPVFGKPHTSGTNLLRPCKSMANRTAGAPFAMSSFYLSDQIVESCVQVAGPLSYTALVELTDALPPHYVSDRFISATASPSVQSTLPPSRLLFRSLSPKYGIALGQPSATLLTPWLKCSHPDSHLGSSSCIEGHSCTVV